MDVYTVVQDVLDSYGPRITASLREETRNSGLKRRDGKLARGFRHRIRKSNLEVWGISFQLPRYGYIQNAGISPGRQIKNPKTGTSYIHPGRTGKGFIQTALDRHVDDMFKEITEKVGADVVASLRI